VIDVREVNPSLSVASNLGKLYVSSEKTICESREIPIRFWGEKVRCILAIRKVLHQQGRSSCKRPNLVYDNTLMFPRMNWD
jgi:hypothetical protein